MQLLLITSNPNSLSHGTFFCCFKSHLEIQITGKKAKTFPCVHSSKAQAQFLDLSVLFHEDTPS